MKKIFLISLILSPIFNYGQLINVAGKVQDEAGNPLPGSSIRVIGKGAGIYADNNGNFTLSSIYNKDSIVCSQLGYVRRGERIEGNSTIIFILQREKQYSHSLTIPVDKSHTDFNNKIWHSKDNEDRIFTSVEVRAEFPGGNLAFNKGFQKRFIMPDSAKITFNHSVIKLGLIISKDGKLKKIMMIKGINAPINKAVTDALIKMPSWLPANQNGRKVDDYTEVSMTFSATE